MKARAPQTVIKPDYRQFRLRKLNTPEFSHIKLLLFWPVFGLAFLALERFRPHAAYHVMHCALDDAIPFSEWALIPYLLWFVYLIGALACTFFQDVVFADQPGYGGDPLLAALFAGITWGGALALLYMRGSSSGNTDFLTMSIKVLRSASDG